MNVTTTLEDAPLFPQMRQTTTRKRAGRSSAQQKREQEAKQLDVAIEEDSEAIARLLGACASSRDFGVEQLRDFQKLFRHRRRLIVRLEKLRQTEEIQ